MSDPAYADPEAEAEIEAVQNLVTEVRRFRSDQGPQARPAGGRPSFSVRYGRRRTRRRHPFPVEAQPGRRRLHPDRPARRGHGRRGDRHGLGTIDVAAERKRLEKDLAVAKKEQAQVTGKLGNEQFMSRRPSTTWSGRSAHGLAQAAEDIARLEAQLAALPQV